MQKWHRPSLFAEPAPIPAATSSSTHLVSTRYSKSEFSGEVEIVAPHHSLFALFPNHSIRLFHPVLWSTSASLPCSPCRPILLFFSCVSAPKLTVKRANRKIITVKESTNGAFPRLTSIIITPRTDGRRPRGGRADGEQTGEWGANEHEERAAGRPSWGRSSSLGRPACVRLAPSFPRSSLPASSSSFP